MGEIERLIRAGQILEARRKLDAIPVKQIPRAHIARLAELERRANAPALALKLLSPFVRSAPRQPTTASEAEIVEYAAALTRLGALDEAARWLEPFDAGKFPRVGLERAAILIARWRYGESIPLLKAFVEHPKTRVYDRLVGKVNLAAALIHEGKHRQAGTLLRELLHETSVRRLPLLLGNAFRFTALLFVCQRKLREAERFLERATKSFPDLLAADRFFVDKWLAIVRLLAGGAGPAARDGLEKIRLAATRLGDWETCRDCDRYLALSTGDRKLFLKLYFGTPYEVFRRNLLREIGTPVAIPSSYLWSPEEASPKQIINVPEGRIEGRREQTKLHSLGHAALMALSSDLYRPFRVAALFQFIYPEERFNVASSPGRIHQAILRLRRWAKANEIALDIVERSGEYRLVVGAGCALRLAPESSVHEADRRWRQIKDLRNAFPTGVFNALEAAKALDLSRRGVLRVLSLGQEERWIERIGKRAAAKYRFVK